MIGNADDVRSGVHRIIRALGIHRSLAVEKLVADIMRTLSRAESEHHEHIKIRLITFALADLDLLADVLFIHVLKCST